MKNQKFETMVLNYMSGNISDFKYTLKRLDRAQLIQFCVFCDIYYKDTLDIYEIERLFCI